MVSSDYQAVVLAGGEDQTLFPLTTNVVKALLPVANRPLLSYPLKTLADAGLRSVIVIVTGDKAAGSVSAWIAQEYSGKSSLQCEVVSVPDTYGTADALRAVAGRITARTFVVVSGDLLTDVPVNGLVASHQLHSALVTMLLTRRKVSPTTETKPGKAPKNVDYIGLDPSLQQLLFYASSPDALRDLKLPLPLVAKYGSMSIRSDLLDAHMYICDRHVLSILADNPKLSSMRQDVLPFLTQNQLRLRHKLAAPHTRRPACPAPLGGAAGAAAAAAGGAGSGGVAAAGSSSGPASAVSGSDSLPPAPDSATMGDGVSEHREDQGLEPLPGCHFLDMSHCSAAVADGSADSLLRVQLVGTKDAAEGYCARVKDLQAYGDVNRDVADPGVALRLSGLKPSKYDNIVAASTSLGNKATVAAGCIIGENGVVGDKASVKRSVLGHGCKLGTNVKVINSVLMDGVTVGDGAHVQNSILCAGVTVQANVILKDCQVGAGYTVHGPAELKGEVLVGKVPSSTRG